jgi:hypothetical protein
MRVLTDMLRAGCGLAPGVALHALWAIVAASRPDLPYLA